MERKKQPGVKINEDEAISTARFVCFDAKMHEKLSDVHEKKKSLALSNCEVKEAKYFNGLEVVVKKSTEIHHSPKKFEVPDAMFVTKQENLVTVEEIASLPNYQCVSVRVKLVAEEEEIEVKKGLTKQDYWIADTTGCVKIVTWEDNTGLLAVDKCYKLCGLIVRTYKGKKYLSVPRDGFQVSDIDDIGVVENNIPEEEKVTETQITGVCVAGVKYLEKFDGCYSCPGKVMPESEASCKVGKCDRCGVMQRLDKCKEHSSARLDLMSKTDVRSVMAFTQVLEEICHGSPSVEKLLASEDFNATVSDKDVILSISRN